ncbi:MAG: Asp-tRNA(Asn)/Glu-tRNA(Gln) amidotransferase GatCAB subunit B [Rhodocyclaceae bacterium]|jgi:aspartyl-tRNA(Asn)/glutamyl-tRNA(Gln) amidotransferase subunit B|nr:Asp-tRNA(Asn)/Glu-tRNA(Gln) amidotransferase GatCAB subunit B [Rhodocyclaceae bacterium]
MSIIDNWEVVIGLETHAQLNTQSKIFSGAPTAFGAAPNAQACAVDIALPGVLPVLNRGAVERAIRFGLAVGARIAPKSVFARKNYFYPDLPKGYQISQYELPVVVGGGIAIQAGDQEKTVRLTRAHLEEDAGKSLHEDFHGRSGIDLNRAGTPLLEIVTEPDMRSAEEAVSYAKALHALVRWIDICDGNMQEGSFRCDANVSVRRPGEPLGTRREIKNLNSFRFLQQAIEYEIRWQIGTLEDGGKIQQATVLFDPDTGETRTMRTKEDAHDYRYFPDPDLLPLEISDSWIAEVKAKLPELPVQMRERFERDYGLSAYNATTLTATLETARYYEKTVAKAGREQAKTCANWVMGELAARLNTEDRNIAESPIVPEQLAEIVRFIVDGTISTKIAREQIFPELWSEGLKGKKVIFGGGNLVMPSAIIEAKGLTQISDAGAIEKIVDEVLAANPKSVEEFRAGKEKAFNALVGQAMKATKGKANPQQVNELLRRKLAQ